MNPEVFKKLREIVHRESGIALSTEKGPLLSNRLYKRLRTLGLPDENAYLQYLQNDSSGEELMRFIDVISTNVTYFFRESAHFDFLAEQLAGRNSHEPIKIWCAASSSGEEPYTILMTACEAFGSLTPPVRLLATDICIDVLTAAQAGTYSAEAVDALGSALARKYFRKTGNRYTVIDELKRMVLFKRLNLARHPFPLRGGFDFIFCRNVMIYFDQQLRSVLASEFHRLLKPGGLLTLSQCENLMGVNTSFRNIGRSMYQKHGSAEFIAHV